MAGSTGGIQVGPYQPKPLDPLQPQPLQPQQPLPGSVAPLASMTGLQTVVGQTPMYGQDPKNLGGPGFIQNPNVMTDLYRTGATGTTVSGQGSLSQPAYESEQMAQLNAQLQADAERRRLGYLSTITGQQSPMVGAQGGPAFDENAARAVAFARAKEQAGQTANAALKALNDAMASSGMMGSSVEQQGISNIINGAGGAVNNFSRTQLIQDLNRAADIADRNQQNAITQRGQNLSLIPSLMGLITATRGAY